MSSKFVCLIISVLIVLVGCQSSDRPGPSAGVTATTVSQVPQPLTLTPSQTQPPVPSIAGTVATPDILHSPIVDGFLLSSSDDPDCQLPCWHGLRVGISNREDVQTGFDDVLSFHGTIDFFSAQPIYGEALSAHALIIPGYQVVGYFWEDEGIDIRMALDEQTGILQGIRFIYVPGVEIAEGNKIVNPGRFILHTPQQVIRELGTPDHIYAQPAGGGIELMLIYDKGIASFSTMIAVPIATREEEDEYVLVREVCLDAQSEVSEDVVVGPFDLDNADTLTPVHQKWITGLIQDAGLSPVETVLEWTTAEIVDTALHQERPCLITELRRSK